MYKRQVEDDPQAYDYVSSIITQKGGIDIIGNLGSIKEAAKQIKLLKPDFIVLDVFLIDGNAFEFLALFDTVPFRIIFTTSFAKFAIDAFKFSALDYLLKPYNREDMFQALDKVISTIDKENYTLQLNTLLQNLSTEKESQKIVLKNADAIYVVKTKDILYAKSDNNYTTFILSNDKEILISKPLKSFEDKLTPLNFYRVHQTFLINLLYLTSFNKREEQVILDEIHTIPVAQSRKKKLINYLDQYL